MTTKAPLLQYDPYFLRQGGAMTGGISYIDGVGKIWMHNGVVRMELVALTGQGDGKQPVPRPVQEVAIALPEFVRFCVAMQASLADMEKKGLIQRTVSQEGTAGTAQAAAVPTAAGPDLPTGGELGENSGAVIPGEAEPKKGWFGKS